MNNEAFTGKKLLIAFENEALLKSCEISSILQDTFAAARIITSKGTQETINTILKEKPDVVFLHFDEDPALVPVIDIQRQVQEINKLNCKLMVYSKHKTRKHTLETFNRIVFLSTSLSHTDIVDRVSRCLQSKGMKVLIAMDREAAINMIRININVFFPGNHVIYATSGKEAFETALMKCPDIIIVDFTGENQQETFKLLDDLKSTDKLGIKPVILVWSPYGYFKDEYTARGATNFHLWGYAGPDIEALLRPYL